MELKAYFSPLLKWWWLILAATVLGAVSGYLVVSQQPPTYRASTTLMIGRAFEDPNPSGSEFVLSQQLAATYADIAKRVPVREQTKAALGLTWLPEYVARPLPQSQLLEIAVQDNNPVRAQVVANELANQLILQSPTAPEPEELEREAFITDQLSDLQAGIEETTDEIAAKQEELENSFSAREIAGLRDEISALQSKLGALQGNYAMLLSNTQGGAINTLAVIEPAMLPTHPVGPDKRITIMTTAVVGFVLAAGAAYLLEYLDDTIRGPDDIKRITGLPTLPSIPRYESNDDQRMLITSTDPRSPATDAFRRLRIGIFSGNPDNPYRTLSVTSAVPGEGKSSTAANLAIVMAQGGHNVLLVDSDLRRPVQHKLFEATSARGLTDLLVGLSPAYRENRIDALLNDVIQSTAVDRLHLLTTGAIAPNSFDLVNSGTMKRLLAALTERFDILIADSPPLLASSDAVELSTHVDGVLLVTDASSLRQKQLMQAVNQLQEVNANVVGVVLNRITPKTEGYYYYFHEYYEESQDFPGGRQRKRVQRSGPDDDTSHRLRRWLKKAST